MSPQDVKEFQRTANQMVVLLNKLNGSIQSRSEEIKQSKEFKDLNLSDTDIDISAKVSQANMEINSLNDKINALR